MNLEAYLNETFYDQGYNLPEKQLTILEKIFMEENKAWTEYFKTIADIDADALEIEYKKKLYVAHREALENIEAMIKKSQDKGKR